MKRKIIALLMATVCTTAMFASCNDTSSSSSSVEKEPCETHVDVDNNGICDGCDRAVVIITEQLPPEKENKVDMVVNPLPTDAKMSDYFVSTIEKEVVAKDLTATAMSTLYEVGEGEEVRNLSTQQVGPYAILSYTVYKPTVIELPVDPENPDVPPVELLVKEERKDVDKFYDLVNQKVIYENTTDVYSRSRQKDEVTGEWTYTWANDVGAEEEFKTVVSITPQEGCIKIVKKETEVDTTDIYNIHYNYTTTTMLYTFAGELIDTAVDNDSYSSVTATINGDFNPTRDDYVYLTVEKKDEMGALVKTIYALDAKTGALITIEGSKGEPNFYMRRPTFSHVEGKLGYILGANSFKLYNLDKWIDCVYQYTYPSFWTDAKTYVLNNGNILVQYKETLSADAVNFDYKENDVKYDLVQVIIDVETKAQKEVELGYVINSCDYVKANWTDAALNVFNVTAIENEKINTNNTFTAVLDNDLKFLYAHKANVIGLDINSLELVANGVFKATVNYASNISREVLVDADGNLIEGHNGILPNNYSIEEATQTITIAGKVYKMDMVTELLNRADYTSYTIKDGYAVLAVYHAEIPGIPGVPAVPGEGDEPGTPEIPEVPAIPAYTEYFYFNGTAAPVKLSGNAYTFRENYFVEVIETKTEIDNDEDGTIDVTEYKYEYVIYNANNEKVVSFANLESGAFSVGLEEIADGVYGVSVGEDLYMIR